MKAVVATILRHEGYIPVEHNTWFRFKYQGREAAIQIKRLEKGMHIEDNLNHYVRREKWTELKDPLDKFSSGHLMGLNAVESDQTHREQIFAGYQTASDKEVFFMETYYADFWIFLEFPDFRSNVYEDDEKRKRYNKQVFGAFNQFIISFNGVLHFGNVRHLSEEGNTHKYVLKQTYFKLTEQETFETVLQKRGEILFQATSIMAGKLGASGIKGYSDQQIKDYSINLRSSLEKDPLPEEHFLSHALELLHLHDNAKYAFLEAFLAVESSVDRFLDKKKEEAGISKKNNDDFKRETGIGYKMNIELPLALNGKDAEFEELLEAVNKIRKERNGIVHAGKEIPEAEVRTAITIVYRLVRYLDYRSSNQA
jgi:hypothetical protein